MIKDIRQDLDPGPGDRVEIEMMIDTIVIDHEIDPVVGPDLKIQEVGGVHAPGHTMIMKNMNIITASVNIDTTEKIVLCPAPSTKPSEKPKTSTM